MSGFIQCNHVRSRKDIQSKMERTEHMIRCLVFSNIAFYLQNSKYKVSMPRINLLLHAGPFLWELCENCHFNSFSRHWAWFNGPHFCHIKKKIMLWQILINSHNYEIKKIKKNNFGCHDSDFLYHNWLFMSEFWILSEFVL